MEIPIFDLGFGKSGKFYNMICMIYKVKFHVMSASRGNDRVT